VDTATAVKDATAVGAGSPDVAAGTPGIGAESAKDEFAVIATNGAAAAPKASNGNGAGTVTLSLGKANVAFKIQEDAPSCAECGSIMVRNGSCYKCLNCGSTSGCS
jgi:ribonucleoside-diphosphate reductase alpha chain